MTRVADTSALYALFDGDDKHHDQARTALADPTPIWIPSEILVETVNLVEYRFGWAPAHRALGALLEKPHVSIAEQVPMDGIWRTFQQAEGELSLADAVVVQTCRVHGSEPIAYDDAILGRAP